MSIINSRRGCDLLTRLGSLSVNVYRVKERTIYGRLRAPGSEIKRLPFLVYRINVHLKPTGNGQSDGF